MNGSLNSHIKALVLSLSPLLDHCMSSTLGSFSIRKMLGNLNSNGLYRSSGKEKETSCLLLTSSTKRKIKHFHVVVVQIWQRNVQKSVMYVQSCRLLNKPIAFFRSRYRRRRRCLSYLLRNSHRFWKGAGDVDPSG